MTEAPDPSVVHVTWAGGVGGIERLVHDLALAQSRIGMDVSVAFGQANGLFADRLRALGIEVLDLGLRSGYDVRPGTATRAARMLARSDVVHAHAFNLPFGAIMRRARRPIVLTHHGNFAQGRSLGIRGRVTRTMQARFLRRGCEVVVANSRWTADRVCATYGLRRDRVTVVHNGIDVHGLTPARPTPDGSLTIAFVGRLVRFKRVDRLLKAISMLDPGLDARVLIAGGGPLEQELRALASELGVDTRARFLGWQDDIRAVLREADVLVLPSEDEPFGLAMVEAAAQGLVGVAFADGGGVLETVGPDGRVVNDVGELADVLSDLAGSEALSAAARRARSDWASAEFGIGRTAARYGELYRAALEETT
jgi:glycosyltransferase involved in cell wall biosynthesis